MNNLTILIPTYNRKVRIIEMLNSLYLQNHLGEYDLVISDNHSDYDVKSLVESKFPKDFTNYIKYNSWKFNTGLSTNIAISFLLVETKWCFFLSDDDEILPGTLDHIFNDIQMYKDHCAIKYSIKNHKRHEERDLKNIDDYIEYYSDKKRSGEKIFMSMVYNLDVLKPFLSDMTMYSYCYAAFLTPILHCLVEKNGYLHTSSFIAYNYKDNNDTVTKNSTNFMRFLLGFRTFDDIIMTFSTNKRQELSRIMFLGIYDSIDIYRRLFSVKDINESYSIYNKLRPYINNYNIIGRVFQLFFLLRKYTRIDICNFLMEKYYAQLKIMKHKFVN